MEGILRKVISNESVISPFARASYVGAGPQYPDDLKGGGARGG